MKISEIKDKELRELAELRSSEQPKWKSDNLDNAFNWMNTKEGYGFWIGVSDGRITSLKPKQDSIVESVVDKFKSRSKAGIEKYGVTLDRNDLSRLEWLTHLQEELMDATLYIERLKKEL